MRVATGNQREPGDWTVTHNGQKFGIDRKFIHIGPVSIPTAILALLPLNVTGNPSTIERERRSSEIHSDIMAQAQRRINDADVDKAIKAIRERKDRERREKAEREKTASGTGAEGEASPPTGN
jgi:hypothetical protein